MNFSKEELDKNCAWETKLYHEAFPEKRQPRRKSSEKLLDSYIRNDFVVYGKSERTKRKSVKFFTYSSREYIQLAHNRQLRIIININQQIIYRY